MIQSYRDLDVYQRAMILLPPVHNLLVKFPDYEKYELCAQIRPCSKSIPANIAEGYSKRRFEKEFRRHLNIAMGEANEIVVHIEISRALDYIDEPKCAELVDGYTIVGKQLFRLMSNWRSFPAKAAD
jgi:four helix bundle protein